MREFADDSNWKLNFARGQEVQRPKAEPSKIIERGDEKVRDRRSFWELRRAVGLFCHRLLKHVHSVNFCLALFLFMSYIYIYQFLVQSSNGLLFLFAVCILRIISSNFMLLVFTGPKYVLLSCAGRRSPDRSDSVSGLQAEQKNNPSPLHQTHSVKALGKKLAMVNRCKSMQKYQKLLTFVYGPSHWCPVLMSSNPVAWPSQQSRGRYQCSTGARVHWYIPCATAKDPISIAEKDGRMIEKEIEKEWKQKIVTWNWRLFQSRTWSWIQNILRHLNPSPQEAPSHGTYTVVLHPNKAWEEWGKVWGNMWSKTFGIRIVVR